MAAPELRIRAVGPDDYPALAMIWSEAFPEEAVSAAELAHLDAAMKPPYRMQRLVAEQSGAVVGTAVFKHSVGSFHPQRFLVELAVASDHRGRGIGAALYARLREELAPLTPIGLRTQVHADDARAVRFARERGFVETKRDTVSVLELEAFDPAVWRERVERVVGAGVRLRSLPELEADGIEWRRPFFDLFAAVRRDVPRSDPVAEIDYDWYATTAYGAPDFAAELAVVAIAAGPPGAAASSGQAGRDVGAAAGGDRAGGVPGDDAARGRWVGMTQLWRGEDAASTGTVHTGLTGVLPAWRGRGVAVALKVDALRRAREAGYLRVTTDNDERNAAMLAINARLGFEPQATIASMSLELGTGEASPG